jgi:hypothetical protein
MRKGSEPAPFGTARPRTLDATTEQQAIAFARCFIELRGGLSHEYSRDYWRFSTKAELRGQVEAGERFVQGIKDHPTNWPITPPIYSEQTQTKSNHIKRTIAIGFLLSPSMTLPGASI